MPISQYGQLNTTALTVANVYVQIVQPQYLLNGVPSNIVGYVGTASWGPVNQPQIIGSPASYQAMFGPVMARSFDMGTYVMIGHQQGALVAKCVRVTDGTDVAASAVVQTNCITFTSKYTGSYGNQCQVTISNGSRASSYMVRVQMPGIMPEIFDNIGAGLTGNALWVAIAAAINSGISNLRSGSNLIVASAGAGTTAPTPANYTLSGGTDGATTISGTIMLGSDTFPRTGMYALRNQDVSVATLCDMTDASTVASQEAFGKAEGVYMVYAGASGQTISAAKTAKTTAAIDSYAVKWLIGDWVSWNDTQNGLLERLVSPAAFAVGILANLSPQFSTLNQRVQAVVATQKSKTGIPYTDADIQELVLSGIDVLMAPSPGGNYYAFRTGHNTSSNPATRGDNYTRMTNYLASTLNKGMGIYIGKLQSRQPNDDTRRRAKVTLDTFLASMQQQAQIDEFDVTLDLSNNPVGRIATGYMQADVKVVYLSIVEFFVINLEGGQTVQISRRGTPTPLL